MATPDHIQEIFEDTTEQVEVRGDFVHLTVLSRFGEVILDCQMTADEADGLAAKLLDAVTTIDLRSPPPPPVSAEDLVAPAAWDRGPPPPEGFREVGVDANGNIEGYRLGDSVDPATGKTYRQVDPRPNPTFSEAVDDLFAAAAPRMAASA